MSTIDIDKKDYVDKRAKKINFPEGSAIANLVSEFMKDSAEERKVENLRSTADDETWELFVTLFLQYTVPHNVWKAQSRKAKLSDFITVWDESFAMVAVESNMKLWMHLAAGKSRAEAKGLELYVVKGRKEGKKKTRIGWTVEGRKRYNAICDGVQKNRDTDESKRKEDVLLKKWTENGQSAAEIDSDDEWEKEMQELEEFEPRGAY